ncbi:MAG: uroporphyrinogen-III synthase [Corynebacterium sp.]|nr:uroporphyrinogen-III synthase [Corynebacterium sp.]
MSGRITFVGAGPGNPELLTVTARTVLAGTVYALVEPGVSTGVREVISSDLPVPQEKIAAAEEAYNVLVSEAKAAGARRRPARPAPPSAAEITIMDGADPRKVAAWLQEATAEGEDAVRLVSGNPLSQPSVLAEINCVTELGLDFHIVPGMSLPATVPMFAGIATGHTFTEVDVTAGAEINWETVAAAPQPLVVQAQAEDLAEISSSLIAAGLAGVTPTTVTVNGTTRLQRSLDTTLKNLGKLEGELPGQLVVTIGKGVDERTKYSWWENRSLYGWRVLVPDQVDPMATRLSSYGAIPREVPTISVEPPRNPAQMERAVKGLVEGRYEWVVLTSSNAVHALWGKISEFGLDSRSFAGVKVAAIGVKTMAAVRKLGITPELVPPSRKQNVAGLLEQFPDYDSLIDLVGRVLVPRSDAEAEELVEGIRELGWEVDDVVAYRTVRAAPPSAEIRDMIKSGGFDAACFTSIAAVRNLVGIAGKPHARTIVACIDRATAEVAKELGMRVDVVPENAAMTDLVDSLAQHVASLRAAGTLPAPRKKRRARK